ncbi:MAG: hypothetical protein N2745_01760 [Syntrophorhabdaceae bacterium]|nr:hypothetical protein [Syntrophorhabdaceae bacterium]
MTEVYTRKFSVITILPSMVFFLIISGSLYAHKPSGEPYVIGVFFPLLGIFPGLGSIRKRALN